MKIETLFDNKLNCEMIYWIGENAQDNWNIISDSNQNDLWFHLSNHPSCHVILKMPEGITYKDLSKQTLINCGIHCKLHSKFTNISSKNKMRVIYTEIKNVSKGERIGSVHTKKERILFV